METDTADYKRGRFALHGATSVRETATNSHIGGTDVACAIHKNEKTLQEGVLNLHVTGTDTAGRGQSRFECRGAMNLREDAANTLVTPTSTADRTVGGIFARHCVIDRWESRRK